MSKTKVEEHFPGNINPQCDKNSHGGYSTGINWLNTALVSAIASTMKHTIIETADE